MIGQLRGILRVKQAPLLVVDVNGIGYELEAPLTTFQELPSLGKEVSLHTHLLIREDAHLLYGFSSMEQKYLFRALIKVSGIGAKVSLAILSGMDVNEFHRCLQEKDIIRLTTLPGIGKRTAERLIVEMQGHLTDSPVTDFTATASSSTNTANVIRDAISALTALGYKPQEASRRVQAINTENMSIEAIIREALRSH